MDKQSGKRIQLTAGEIAYSDGLQLFEVTRDLHALNEARKLQWEKTVGKKPEDTKITIVVSVYNEEKNLETFFGNFSLTDMPWEVDCDMLVVVNNSTDGSYEMAVDCLTILTNSEAEEVQLDDDNYAVYEDHGLSRKVSIFRKGNTTFRVINTTTPGKANALNIANRHAKYRKDDLVINLDANNYPEQDVLREVTAAGYKEVVNGKKYFVDVATACQKRTGEENIIDRALLNFFGYRDGTIVNTHRSSNDISGWCMAWNPDKLESIGGVPSKGGDDYVLGVLARSLSGIESINERSKARVWGLSPTVVDRIKGSARWYKERLQLVDYVEDKFPEHANRVREILAEERNFGVGEIEQVRRVWNQMREEPKSAKRRLA